MADCPGGQKGTGKLRDLHGKPPQSKRTTHPVSGKWSRRGRRLTWLDVESLTELQHRKKSEQKKVGVGTVQENYGSLV